MWRTKVRTQRLVGCVVLMPEPELLSQQHSLQCFEPVRTRAAGRPTLTGLAEPLPGLAERVPPQVDPGERQSGSRVACRLLGPLLGGECLGLIGEMCGSVEVSRERLDEREAADRAGPEPTGAGAVRRG